MIKLSIKPLPKINGNIKLGNHKVDICRTFIVRKISNVDKYTTYNQTVGVY